MSHLPHQGVTHMYIQCVYTLMLSIFLVRSLLVFYYLKATLLLLGEEYSVL